MISSSKRPGELRIRLHAALLHIRLRIHHKNDPKNVEASFHPPEPFLLGLVAAEGSTMPLLNMQHGCFDCVLFNRLDAGLNGPL